eukprot:13995211-Heterocapsa_arctica.AAC.1
MIRESGREEVRAQQVVLQRVVGEAAEDAPQASWQVQSVARRPGVRPGLQDGRRPGRRELRHHGAESSS